MNTKIKVFDTVRIKDRPEIVFGVRMIQKAARLKGLYIWGQWGGGTQIIAYNKVELVRKGPRHKNEHN